MMNVLSLFDGMSCGQQALERAGIKVNQYFASEIDKYAIQVTMANYPNTIQLGSVVGVDGYALPKIDLLIGGSPCQSFSFAGKRKGMSTKDEQEILTLEHYLQLKSEGYEFEGQSYLFWEFMRLLNEVKPKYFLLENVEMGEKWERVLTQAIGVNALHINSALVSAQNRKRIYFTNIGMEAAGLFGDLESIIEQPKDRGILLKDILESEVDEKYFLSEKMIKCLDSKKGTTYDTFYPADINNKGRTINSRMAKMGSGDNYIVHNTQRRDPNRPSIQKNKNAGGTGHLSRADGKTYCLDTGNTNAVEVKAIMLGRSENWGQPEKDDGKSYTICMGQPNGIKSQSRIRRLTPIECERLQTVKAIENNIIFDLCYEQAKNYVNAVNQSPKLLKLVLNAEKTELNELVKNVWLNMNASHQSTRHIVQRNVDMPIPKETKRCINLNQKEISTIVNNVEKSAISQHHKEMDSADLDVFINIIEGKITHFGLEELRLKDNHFAIPTNGNKQLKLFGQEIMQIVEDVEKSLNIKRDNNFISTISYLLNTKNLEQALIIYYLFAKNAIIGYTQDTIQIKNLSLNFSLNHGYSSHVSDTQRYRMLGNGWTIDVIVHIFKYIK